jgi:hypothetical protein
LAAGERVKERPLIFCYRKDFVTASNLELFYKGLELSVYGVVVETMTFSGADGAMQRRDLHQRTKQRRMRYESRAALAPGNGHGCRFLLQKQRAVFLCIDFL